MLLNLKFLFYRFSLSFNQKDTSEVQVIEQSMKHYLKRLESYMKVYDSLVQVCCDSLKFIWTIFAICWLCFLISPTEQLTMLALTNWNSAHSKFARLERRLGVACKVIEFYSMPANQYTVVSLDAFLQGMQNVWCFGIWIF